VSGPLRDHLGRPVVAITGIGVVTSLGIGTVDNWSRLSAGQSGIRTITRFPTEGLRSTIAGTVDALRVEPYSAADLATAIAETAGREAIAQAGIGRSGAFPGRLIVATPPSELEWPHLCALHAAGDGATPPGYARLLAAARTGAFSGLARHVRFASIADRLQDLFGTRGEPLSICTACASGATTIQLGAEALRRGDLDAVLCIGTDATVHPEGLIRFSLLSALSTRNEVPAKASRPFAKDRDGFVVAEGAGAVVIEDYDRAKARGAPILAELMGYGMTADAADMVNPSIDGASMAMQMALQDAAVSPSDIDYINAHGTATTVNDLNETRAIKRVFGNAANKLSISSTKSMHGHCLGAGGGIEAVAAVKAIEEKFVPATVGLDEVDPECDLDYTPNVGRKREVNYAMSNSFAFGGLNAVLVFGPPPA